MVVAVPAGSLLHWEPALRHEASSSLALTQGIHGGINRVLQAFLTDETGQSLTEYASIVALVALTVLLLLIAFREQLASIFAELKEGTTEVQRQVKERPGLGQGAGCPSVGGCK